MSTATETTAQPNVARIGFENAELIAQTNKQIENGFKFAYCI